MNPIRPVRDRCYATHGLSIRTGLKTGLGKLKPRDSFSGEDLRKITRQVERERESNET